MQQQRRNNPYPTTWEIPLAIAVGALALLLWGVHIGRGIATLIAGHGWTWPEYMAIASSLPAILAGDATAGLAEGTLPAHASVPVLGWVIAVELVLLITVLLGSVWAWARWGPGRMLGMATPTEVEQTLGVSRLRKNRHIIRPDLYAKKRAHR